MTRKLVRAIAGLVALAGILLFGLASRSAGGVDSGQLLLQLSDMPAGTQITLQGPLVPGSWDNGLVNRDGTDVVHGYESGAWVEFIVPVAQAKVRTPSGTRSSSVADMENWVYRFADEQAAANELQRLLGVVSGQIVGAPATGVDAAGRRFASLVVGGGPGFFDVTIHWFFLQRDNFLVILSSPGPISLVVGGENTVSKQVTAQELADYNRAVEELFAKSVATLSR